MPLILTNQSHITKTSTYFAKRKQHPQK